jgi:cytoskeletal protein RodZ
MQLRGFDDYEVTLGDEIRGERASLGRSLADVERELHIKAELILGIENCDLSAFPNRSVVAGYVRSYARYLGMDQERFYRRFCEESGFVPPNAGLGGAASAGGGAAAGQGRMLSTSPLDESRFAAPPAQSRFAARVSLGSLASGLALLALVAGLGYGGYALLQNVQRVGFAPLPEAPEVVAEPPRIAGLANDPQGSNRPAADAYSGTGALAAVFAPDDSPPIRRRDGPISAIDPGEAGLFADAAPRVAPRVAEAGPAVDSADDAIREAREQARLARVAREVRLASARPAAEPAAPAGQVERGIAIRVTDRAWIRVRNDDRAIIYEGILPPGGDYELPERVARGELRAGNAGAVYIVVDGETHGPVGRPGGVVKNVSLAREDVRATFPAAGPVLMASEDDPAERRAEAELAED